MIHPEATENLKTDLSDSESDERRASFHQRRSAVLRIEVRTRRRRAGLGRGPARSMEVPAFRYFKADKTNRCQRWRGMVMAEMLLLLLLLESKEYPNIFCRQGENDLASPQLYSCRYPRAGAESSTTVRAATLLAQLANKVW